MKHILKTDTEAFRATADMGKRFEIRFDDRGFKTKYSGEEMKAGAPLEYTGYIWHMPINYILRGPVYGLKEGWVIIS